MKRIIIAFFMSIFLMGCSAINQDILRSEELAKIEESNSIYKRAIEDYKVGVYKAAEIKMIRALELLPEKEERKEYEVLLKKLKTVSKFIPMQTGDKLESELIRRGVSYYMDGDIQFCLDFFSYALYLQPENERLKKICRATGYEQGISVSFMVSGLCVDIITEKMFQSLGLYNEGKFPEVVKLCNEVLMLNPTNAIALERLGNAYYKLGKKYAAKRALEKAYMFNLKDEGSKKLIEKIDKELKQIEDDAK